MAGGPPVLGRFGPVGIPTEQRRSVGFGAIGRRRTLERAATSDRAGRRPRRREAQEKPDMSLGYRVRRRRRPLRSGGPLHRRLPEHRRQLRTGWPTSVRHRHIVLARKHFDSSHPTFDPIAVAGCLLEVFKAMSMIESNTRTASSLWPSAQYQQREERIARMDDQEVEAAPPVPDPRVWP